MQGFDGLYFLIGEKFWIALADQRQCQYRRPASSSRYSVQRTRSAEIAQRGRAVARQPADQREQDRNAGGGRDEVLHRHGQHLRQVAHGGEFARRSLANWYW